MTFAAMPPSSTPAPLLHFTHGNSYPSGAYGRLLALLRRDYEVRVTDMLGHDPRFPVDDNWRSLVDELSSTVARPSWSAIRWAAQSVRLPPGAGPTWRAAW
jgi:hypothetical protein